MRRLFVYVDLVDIRRTLLYMTNRLYQLDKLA